MKQRLLVLLCISGWCVAGYTIYYYGAKLQALEEVQQARADMSQIGFNLWDYAQKHDGHLPPAIKGGLPGYIGSEGFLSYGYDFLLPNERLFTLHASAPLLRRELQRTPGYEIIWSASGVSYTQKLTHNPK